MARFLSFLVGFILLGLSGCKPSAPAGESTPNPKVLRIAVSVMDEELAMDRLEVYGRVASYLESRLGLKVETVKTTGYGVNIEAMRAEKLDVSSFSPFPYILAQQKAKVVPLLTYMRKNGEPSTYTTVFITYPESGLKSLEEVKVRAKEITLAFANPASTSGHLVPRSILQEMGLEPERDFRRVVFSENHVVSVMNVRAKKVELAAVTKTTLKRLIDRKDLDPSAVTVLWESPPMIQNVLCVRAGLPDKLVADIKAAYLALPESEPALWQDLVKLQSDRDIVYMPVDDSMFDEYRRLARSVKNLRLFE